jgi:hypothetical protein
VTNDIKQEHLRLLREQIQNAHAVPEVAHILRRAGWRAVEAGWVRELAPIHAAAWYGIEEGLRDEDETDGSWETGG